MRIQIFCFSALLITAGILHAAMPRDFKTAESETRASNLWKNGNIISHSFHAHGGPVAAVFVIDDGTIVSAGEKDRSVYVWKRDGATYKTIKEMVTDVDSRIKSTSFSATSNRLALLYNDGVIVIGDIQSGKILNRFDLYTSFIDLMDISPDGTKLALNEGTHDNIITLLDTIKNTKIKIIKTEYPILSIAFSPDGKKLAASEKRPAAKKVWDLTTFNESTFSFTEAPVWLSFLQNGELIAYNQQPIGTDKPFIQRFWDVQTGKQISEWTLPATTHLNKIFFAHKSSLIAANLGKKIDIYNIRSGKMLKEFDIKNQATSLAFSPDDKMLVAGCKNGDIVTWEVPNK